MLRRRLGDWFCAECSRWACVLRRRKETIISLRQVEEEEEEDSDWRDNVYLHHLGVLGRSPTEVTVASATFSYISYLALYL